MFNAVSREASASWKSQLSAPRLGYNGLPAGWRPRALPDAAELKVEYLRLRSGLASSAAPEGLLIFFVTPRARRLLRALIGHQCSPLPIVTHPVRREAVVRTGHGQILRWEPLRTHRRQRLRQIHPDESAGRRSRCQRGRRHAADGHAPRQTEPEPIRLRGRAGAGRGDAGPRRDVAGDDGARPHLRRRRSHR